MQQKSICHIIMFMATNPNFATAICGWEPERGKLAVLLGSGSMLSIPYQSQVTLTNLGHL